MGTVKSQIVSTEALSKKTPAGVNLNVIGTIEERFARINHHIESGKEIPSELTKNFVTAPLSDDPSPYRI